MTAVLGLLAGETILLQAAPSGEKTEQRAPQLEGWKLVWADEFDKDGPPIHGIGITKPVGARTAC